MRCKLSTLNSTSSSLSFTFFFTSFSELVQDSCSCIYEDYQARDRMIIIMTPYDRICIETWKIQR